MHSPLSHAEEFAGGGAFSCRKDLKEDGSRCIMEVPGTGKGTPVSEKSRGEGTAMRHVLAVVSKGIFFFILTVLALYLLLALTAFVTALFQVRRNAADEDKRLGRIPAEIKLIYLH